jgi:hypothetical protein
MQKLSDKRETELARALVDSLNGRAQAMVRMRFGLDGADECTLEQIGVAFSLTRERVRQIVNTALLEARTRAFLLEGGPQERTSAMPRSPSARRRLSSYSYSSRPRKKPETTSP